MVDAQDLGSCALGVRVRVPSPAPSNPSNLLVALFLYAIVHVHGSWVADRTWCAGVGCSLVCAGACVVSSSCVAATHAVFLLLLLLLLLLCLLFPAILGFFAFLWRVLLIAGSLDSFFPRSYLHAVLQWQPCGTQSLTPC